MTTKQIYYFDRFRRFGPLFVLLLLLLFYYFLFIIIIIIIYLFI